MKKEKMSFTEDLDFVINGNFQLMKMGASFYNIPVIASARHVDGIYFPYEEKGLSLKQYFRTKFGDGPYILDCFLYVQLIIDIFRRERCGLPATSPFNRLVLFHPVLNSNSSPLLCGFVERAKLQDKILYLRPENNTLFNVIQKTSCLSKGQWLYRRSDEQFLGLLSDGPKTMSLMEWASLTHKNLEKEIREDGTLDRSLKQSLLGVIRNDGAKIWYTFSIVEGKKHSSINLATSEITSLLQ